MSRALAATIATALALVPLGCGGSSEPPERSPLRAATIEYSKGGGIAGIGLTLLIRPDGSATLESGERGSRPVRFALGQAELEELRAEHAATPWDELDAAFEEGEPSGCADCFGYTVTVGDQSFSLDDLQRSEGIGEQANPAISLLEEIAARGAS
ncbi:MAG: hypothetical protein H0W09_07275 [Solirubrobacterales bacterium]|nr:hypothetical protein [Solirubrobacterales bacterium]